MIYFDYAASTPLDADMFNELRDCYLGYYANPSSSHFFGKEVRNILESNREELAGVLGVDSEELIFCSGGTEANNLAIFGSVYANKFKGKHIISTTVEHKSVLTSLAKLETEGFDVTYVHTDGNGIVNLDDLKRSLRKDTILVCILAVNNETGIIQPCNEISQIIRSFNTNIVISYDIVAGFPKIITKLNQLDADLVSISGHKLYAPKGTGLLYVRKGIRILPQILGGEQEFGLRGGTEKFADNVFLCKSIKKCVEERDREWQRLEELKSYFEQNLEKRFGNNILVVGKNVQRIPHILNVCFKNKKSREIIDALSEYKICVSSGSACKEHSGLSHVISAMGIPEVFAQGAVRFSFGRYSSKDEIEYTIEALTREVSIR